MSVRWQNCIDHADKQTKPTKSPDCLLGVVPQLTDSRLSETSPSEAAVVTPLPLRGVATPAVGTACDLRRRHCASTSKCRAQYWRCEQSVLCFS